MMDRFENVVKVEEVIKYAQSRQFDKAFEVLEQVNIAKIKNYDDLLVFAEVYLKNKKYIEAKELLERIHEKNVTRRVIALLINVTSKMHNYVEAEAYYEEYVKMAPKDVNRFILRYKIDKSKGLNNDILIKSLENLKEFDLIEEWEYELAKLYHKAGYDDKCISECNTIIMMFGAGVIVEKAKLLRDHHIDAISKNTTYSITGISGADSDFNATVQLNDIIDQVKEKMSENDEQAKEIEALSSDEEDYGEKVSVSALIEEEYAKDNDKISDEFIENELKEKASNKKKDKIVDDSKQEVYEVVDETTVFADDEQPYMEKKPENDKNELEKEEKDTQQSKEEITDLDKDESKEEDGAKVTDFTKAAKKISTVNTEIKIKKLDLFVAPEFNKKEEEEKEAKETKESKEQALIKAAKLREETDKKIMAAKAKKARLEQEKAQKEQEALEKNDLEKSKEDIDVEKLQLHEEIKEELDEENYSYEDYDDDDYDDEFDDYDDYDDYDDDDDYDDEDEKPRKKLSLRLADINIFKEVFVKKKDETFKRRSDRLDEIDYSINEEEEEDKDYLELEAIVSKAEALKKETSDSKDKEENKEDNKNKKQKKKVTKKKEHKKNNLNKKESIKAELVDNNERDEEYDEEKYDEDYVEDYIDEEYDDGEYIEDEYDEEGEYIEDEYDEEGEYIEDEYDEEGEYDEDEYIEGEYDEDEYDEEGEYIEDEYDEEGEYIEDEYIEDEYDEEGEYIEDEYDEEGEYEDDEKLDEKEDKEINSQVEKKNSKESPIEKKSDHVIVPDYNNSGIENDDLDEEEYNHIMRWLTVLLTPSMYDASKTEDIDPKIFRNYYDIRDMRSNIRCALSLLEKNTVKGNFIICGEKQTGKTTVAKMIAKTAYMKGIVDTSKIARIDAEKFNNVDLEYKQDKLADGCLIIQRAHLLTPAAMTSLITMIIHINGRIVVFLETEYEHIAKLYLMTKEVREYFSNVVSTPEYTSQELMGFANSYAAYKNYSFSEGAAMAMEDIITMTYGQLEKSQRIPYVLTTVEKAIRAAVGRSQGGFVKPNVDGYNILEIEDVEQQY